MVTTVDCTIVRFAAKKIIPYLFIAHLQMDHYFREVTAFSSGSMRQRTSKENLSDLSILLPDLCEQQKIAAESNQLATLKIHKQSLMQQLFPAPEAAST